MPGVRLPNSPMTVTNATARIALVGCGRWGRHILRDLSGLGCAVQVVDPAPAARSEARARGAVSVHASLDELSGVDGYVVASPTATHAAVVETLLPAGLPVYVEKPLADDPATARRLAIAGAGRLFVMHKWRYHPGIEALAGIAAGATLGPVTGLATVRVQSGYDHGDVDPVWTLAPHDLSIAQALLGTIPPLRAAHPHLLGGKPCGVIALFGGAPWLSCEVSACGNERRRQITLHCDRGIAVLPAPESDHIDLIRFARDGQRLTPDRQAVPIAAELPLARELRAFVEHLRGGPPPLAPAAEGAAVVEAIAAMRAACGLENAT